MRRSIWFWLYFIIAIVLATYFSVRVVMTGLGRGAAAHVKTISINADTPDKDLGNIATAAAIAPASRTYSVDLATLNKRVNDVPGVRNAAIRRRPDGNLTIQVQLYRAVALWTDGINYFPVSADGTIVNQPSELRDEENILFRGSLPGDISAITNAAHNMIGDIDYLEWIEGRRWNLHTRDGIIVMLPEDAPIDAIGALILLNKNHQILSRKINVIDMRDTARILVK